MSRLRLRPIALVLMVGTALGLGVLTGSVVGSDEAPPPTTIAVPTTTTTTTPPVPANLACHSYGAPVLVAAPTVVAGLADAGATQLGQVLGAGTIHSHTRQELNDSAELRSRLQTELPKSRGGVLVIQSGEFQSALASQLVRRGWTVIAVLETSMTLNLGAPHLRIDIDDARLTEEAAIELRAVLAGDRVCPALALATTSSSLATSTSTTARAASRPSPASSSLPGATRE